LGVAPRNSLRPVPLTLLTTLSYTISLNKSLFSDSYYSFSNSNNLPLIIDRT